MVKNPPGNEGDMRQEFDPWVGKIPWRRAQQPIPVFLPGESPWTEEPGGLAVQRVAKSRTQLKRLTTAKPNLQMNKERGASSPKKIYKWPICT